MYVFWAFKITRIGHSKKRPQTRKIAPYVGVHPDEARCDGQYLATTANAVDHAVERRVLLVDRIVWIHQVLLRGHLIFFFNDTATTEIYTLSLHDALPI